MNYNEMFRVFDNGGETADRYTAFLRDDPEQGALGMSDAPTHPQGFSQWGDFDIDAVEANNVEISFGELPTNIQKHIIDRFEITEAKNKKMDKCECTEECNGTCECPCSECKEKVKLKEHWKDVVFSMLNGNKGSAAQSIKNIIVGKFTSMVKPAPVNELHRGAIKIIGDDVVVNGKTVGTVENDMDDHERGIVLKLNTGEDHAFDTIDELHRFIVDTFRIKEFNEGPIQVKGDYVYVNGKKVGKVNIDLNNEKSGIKVLLSGGEGYEFQDMRAMYQFIQGKFNLKEDCYRIVSEATTEQKYIVAALRQLAKKLDIKQPRFRSLNGKAGFVEMSPKDGQNNTIPNELRVKAVTKIFNTVPRNFSDVDHGNITKRAITLTAPQWVELLQYYGIDGTPPIPVTEGKHDYQIYHDLYSDAISEAVAKAERFGFEVDPEDRDSQIAMGPRKPSPGDTNSFNLTLTKDGKPTRKKLAIQVYGMPSGKYELTAYIS